MLVQGPYFDSSKKALVMLMQATQTNAGARIL